MIHRLAGALWLVGALICACIVPWVSPGHAALLAAPVLDPRPQWLRIDPRHPTTLFIGGAFESPQCPTILFNVLCGSWLARSTDGGATWQNLTAALNQGDPETRTYVNGCAGTALPLVVGPDGRYVYEIVGENCGTPDSMFTSLLRSADRGTHWRLSWSSPGFGGLAISPVFPQRLYGLAFPPGAYPGVVASDDGGGAWHTAYMGNTPLVSCGDNCLPASLVADPVHADTVYPNLADGGLPVIVARSDDAGRHWRQVAMPREKHGVTSFEVTTDPQEPGLLEGRTYATGIPLDRRYLPSDGGRTWRRTTCPGDSQHTCPTYVVRNVFGNGASYAFVNGGIYRFVGGGPSSARLAISSRVPCMDTGRLMDVQAGARAGDPAYLLDADPARGPQLYRGTDAGRSWQRLMLKIG